MNSFTERIFWQLFQLWIQKGSLGFSVGLRANKQILPPQITQDSTFYNNYFQVYPSAFLTYEIAAGREINMSYSRRVQRPGGRQLNPFIDYSDPFNLRSGNPYLLPAFTVLMSWVTRTF